MPNQFEAVSIIGLGYIGLPTAATIASRGIQVLGVDTSLKAVTAINAARAHFSEPDLDGLVHSTVRSGRLKAFTEPQPADAFIVAVPTPIQPDKQPDISYVEQATRSICKVLKAGDLVILESTSPVGTTQKMADVIAQERPDLVSSNGLAGGLQISMAYCPERILPGRMVYELVQNDRIVGGITPECARRAKELYSTFVRGQIFETSAAAAELVKLIENAYRDVNIAFANEVANVCDHLGLDAWQTIALANRHPRVKILNPGPGVGGHCIAVDPWFLITQYPELTQVMRAARNVNDGRPHSVVERIEATLKKAGSKKVCCLGLSYKADVDDLRESPAVEIVEMLGHKGYEVTVVEPHVTELPKALDGHPNIRLHQLEDAIAESDVVALLVAHMPFRSVERSSLQGKHLVDCVGSWN